MSESKANLNGSRQTETATIWSPATSGNGAAADAVPPARPTLTLAQQVKAAAAVTKNLVEPHTCKQSLKVSLFFDGTGNNLKADLHTLEHSNVARMYRAHTTEDRATGIFPIYVPGIGTLFPEIGDKGQAPIVDTHNAMGAMGQARIDWAMTELQTIITKAEARAQNPTNKITSITLAVFGFSRGATLARAFVRDLLKMKCEVSGSTARWKAGGYPVEFSFLGLWDTVAAVGLPIAAGNVAALREQRMSFGNVTRTALRALPVPGLGAPPLLRATDLAFGAPGADPVSGAFDGHQAWAEGLEVPEVVANCVHMIAGHEVRNSFPVDSTTRGLVKRGNCKEMVYPGVHSDVGGGYRPGEGGRGRGQPMDSQAVSDEGQLLALIPLRAMYDEALQAGVPLRKMRSDQWKPDNERDFEIDPAMQASFDHYMSTIGRGGKTLGAAILAHMRMHFAWRFHHIREKQALRAAGRRTPEEQRIAQNERVWGDDQRRLDSEMAQLQSQQDSLRARSQQEQQQALQSEVDRRTLQPTPKAHEEANRILEAYDRQIKDLEARADELRARKQTLPSQGSLTDGLSRYDAQLVSDANAILAVIRQNPKKRAQLRPHYKNLVETFENEYVYQRGLNVANESDRKIIEFFDNYVHDSLADFQKDFTLPSDPRVVYIGGDTKALYSQADGVDEGRREAA